LHPHHYPNCPAKVGFVGTLLLGTTLTWFAPLLEQQPPLLNDLKVFVEEFSTTFGDFDKNAHQLVITSFLSKTMPNCCVCIRF